MIKEIFSICLLLGITAFLRAAKVDTVLVHSTSMNKDIKTIVVYPSFKKKSNTEQYPVIYLLHGAYGYYHSWLEIKPDLPEIADDMGVIFVTPDALNSWYFDSPKLKDFRYETFMIKELLPYIDSHYATIAHREGRAITGLSMGGHGALFLAMRHKELFGACGSMSGGVDIRPFPLNWNLPDVLGEMASNKAEWDSLTVVNQISRIKNGDLAIIFDCGESDFFLEVNKSLHQRLLGAGIDHDFCTRPGAHNSQYWNNSLDYQLVFFKKYFERHHALASYVKFTEK